MFDLFQFTEKTTRLRRNLLVIALLCFCVGVFNVSVGSIPLGGYAIKLPTQAFEFALVSMLIYHFIAFSLAAYDEYKHWELAVVDKMQLFGDGGPLQKTGLLGLIDQKIKYINNKTTLIYDESTLNELKLVIDDFENKFKKYRLFTIIRILSVELVIPLIAFLIALVCGVMQFSIFGWINLLPTLRDACCALAR